MASMEAAACKPAPVNPNGFNPQASIPHGMACEHIRKAMEDFIDFLGFINGQLRTKKLERLESFLMPANFSSIVGEFMAATIPKTCKSLVRNRYHNGHPDLIPAGKYPGDAVQHGAEGIEIKGAGTRAAGRDTTRKIAGYWFLFSTAIRRETRRKASTPSRFDL